MAAELDYIEIEISEFCNLNCRACCDFSNLAKEKKFYSLDEYTKDLLRLKELFPSVKKIRLMGGEPLLNPRVADYVATAREVYPDCDLRIVTNGLLIAKVASETLDSFRQNNCKFDISNYPPTRKMLPEIKNILNSHSIKYDVGFPMDFFYKTILDKPADSPQRAFKNCLFTHCHMLGHGKLAPCSYSYCIGRFNREYATSYPENDVIDIYGDMTSEEILRTLNTPHEFCRYCSRSMLPIKWKCNVKGKNAKPEDWIIKSNFLIADVFPLIQMCLKSVALMIRHHIQDDD